MTDPSDTMLMALADNQIDGPEADALRRRIMADPALAARFAVFTESRAALEAAFAPDDTPEALIEAIRSAPQDEPMGSGPVVVPFRNRPVGLVPKVALAASVLLAVGASGFLAGRSVGPATGAPDRMALAAAALADSATGGEAALAGGGTARVLGTYLTDQGLCRLIDMTLPQAHSERAVACRTSPQAWVVIAAVAAGEAEAYIPASDTAAALIEQVLDDLGAGPALSNEEEAAALDP